MKKSSIIAMVLGAAALVACSDWTTPESISIRVSSLENDYPEVYAQYCQQLRDYKASENHNLVYVAFDNQQSTANGSYRLTSLPDSVDVVEISNPELIDGTLVDEMNKLRTDKGFKFALAFSFDDVKAEYDEVVDSIANAYLEEYDAIYEQGGDPDSLPAPTYPEFDEVFKESLAGVMKYVDEYGFDAVRVTYSDLYSRTHLTEKEDSAYVADQKANFDVILGEIGSRSGVGMYLNADAQYIASEDIIKAAECIILPTESCAGTAEMAYMALRASEVYPDARLVFAVSATLPDDATLTTGYFTAGEQIPLASKWVGSERSKSGLVIYNARNTFFDADRNVYSKLRAAIKNLNPNS